MSCSMTNRGSPALTTCPSVKLRLCRKPSTRATRLTVLTAWTRPTKVPAGVTLFRAAAATVTAGPAAAAGAWSAFCERSQPQSAAPKRMTAATIPPPGGRRIIEIPRRNSLKTLSCLGPQAAAQRPMSGKAVSTHGDVRAGERWSAAGDCRSLGVLVGARNDWRRAALDEGGLDDRSRGHRMGDDLVDQPLEVLDRPEVGAGDEAVFAGDAIAFDDLGHRPQNFRD